MKSPIDAYEAHFSCRFHPTDWWHEVGCPHKEWTTKELQSALIAAKKSNAYLMDAIQKHPEAMSELTSLSGQSPDEEQKT